MLDIYRDPVWELMDAFMPSFGSKIQHSGLRNIKRPHNLANIKNEDGDVIAQKLTVVTTPFKKEDVKVKVVGNTLTVECGLENKLDEDYENIIYRGISSQSWTSTLQLAPSVDKQAITAENRDGILTVTLPLKKSEEKKPDQIDIEVI